MHTGKKRESVGGESSQWSAKVTYLSIGIPECTINSIIFARLLNSLPPRLRLVSLSLHGYFVNYARLISYLMGSSSFYCINTPAVVSEFFDNEVILVNMSRGHYYSLRDTAATLWQGLDAGLSVDALIDRLVESYTIEPAEAGQTVQAFLHQATEQQLIIPTGQPMATKPLETPLERRPFSTPVLETYTDMQDLLALDPIHDVDPQQGWPIQK